MGRRTYTIKLSECYLVPDETIKSCLPPYPQYDDDQEEVFISTPVQKSLDKVHDEGTEEKNDAEEEDMIENNAEEDEDVEVVDDEEALCRICNRPVTDDHQGLLCDKCDEWSHRYCTKMRKQDYKQLTRNENFQWICPSCPPDPQQE